MIWYEAVKRMRGAHLHSCRRFSAGTPAAPKWSVTRRMSEVAADGGGDGKMNLPDWNLDADRGYGSKCWEIGQGTKLEPPPAGGINSNYVGD